MLPKISQYTKALRNKKLSFDKKRSVCEGIVHIFLLNYILILLIILINKFYLGYLFDYSSDQLDKLTLDKLHLWPNDKQISETIHHSHRLARDLAEYAGMIQPSNISIDINALRIFIESHEIDVSSSGINEQSHDNNDDEYNLTSAISEASLEMKQITIEINDDEEQEPSDDFIESCSQ